MTDRELMQFKSRYDWRKNTPVVSAAGMVEHAVSGASFDTSGAVESLVAEVRELTRIVAFLATRLSPSDARALADEIGFECVEPEARAHDPRILRGERDEN